MENRDDQQAVEHSVAHTDDQSTENTEQLGQESAAGSQLQANRRNFLRSVAAVGAGLVLSPTVRSEAAKTQAKGQAAKGAAKAAPKGEVMKLQPNVAPPNPVRPKTPVKQAPKPDDIKIAMIGPGNQGRNLLINCLRVPGVRFTAICDIWPYSQKYASGILKTYDQPVRVYADYQDMLDKEKDLDAVIIATPDWVHSEQTVACLRAGKHVYCEKEMSNTLEGARRMVEAQRETGKLLQIGHQRRSNPRYFQGLKLIRQDKTLGRITHTYGQWNRSHRLDLGWAKGTELSDADLQKYGYETMERFRNWRWYKKFSGGPIADLGSHQIDIFAWFLGTNPSSVMASGGADYYKDREWYDNIMTIYEFNTAAGPVRSFYQVLNTTSYGNYYEVFMGDTATLEISEDVTRGLIYPEPAAKQKQWLDDASQVQSMGKIGILLKVGETLGAGGKGGPKGTKLGGTSAADAEKPPHLLHLENFFNAIRGKAKLNCPPEVGYETAVAVLHANDALASGQRYDFKSDEFHV